MVLKLHPFDSFGHGHLMSADKAAQQGSVVLGTAERRCLK